ncbi:hypothetical protein BN193_08075 [Lactococcus raffinolactis 4877]|nr:hypothetical protein BN193_08075 [Lactococcus raffinolactis 4877]
MFAFFSHYKFLLVVLAVASNLPPLHHSRSVVYIIQTSV